MASLFNPKLPRYGPGLGVLRAKSIVAIIKENEARKVKNQGRPKEGGTWENASETNASSSGKKQQMTSEEIYWLKAKNGNLPAEWVGGKSGNNSRQCGEYSDEAYGVDPQGVRELWDVNLFGKRKEVSHEKTNGTNSMRNMSYEQGSGPTQENWAHKEVNEKGSIPLGLGAEQGSQISELGLNSSNGLQSDGKKDMNRKANCVARN